MVYINKKKCLNNLILKNWPNQQNVFSVKLKNVERAMICKLLNLKKSLPGFINKKASSLLKLF